MAVIVNVNAFSRYYLACFFLLITTASNAAEIYQVTYVYDGETVKLSLWLKITPRTYETLPRQ